MNSTLYNYYVIDKAHHAFREPCKIDLSTEFSSKGLSPEERVCQRLERLLALEVPHIHPDEKIVLMRTVATIPDCFTSDEWAQIKSKHYIHENGYVSNLCPDYEKTIKLGLLARLDECNDYQKRAINAIISLCDRYKDEAVKLGRTDVAATLERVPRYGARNLVEALQFFRILHYTLWIEGEYHNTVGRFDQFMYPYFKQDIDNGTHTLDSALELIEDFFLSFNKDSDLYMGVQQGDNGQSLVLGGTDIDGNDCFNELSDICLTASKNLKLIDPKINLRVSSKTPIEIYERATGLTKVGLGFPQYENDDVVIPALEKLGYAKEDAVNYVVAACWEFIIPGVGNDIANIGALNLPLSVDRAVRRYLPNGESFDGLMNAVDDQIKRDCEKIMNEKENIWIAPSHFMDILRDDKKYNNYGIHGCGIACAADSLAAIKKYVYDEKSVSPEKLITALDTDFANDPELMHKLRFEAPKMGTNDDAADSIACKIMDSFADALEGRKNEFGGVWRAGTGTAMFYLWFADVIGATADGRRKGEPLGTNYSPNLFTKIDGPISVIQSFTKPNVSRTINGGPLTLEFASGIFNSDENTKKVASLIRFFVLNGGHQLQLNAVNLEKMKDAQLHPELYKQLVVRIWGWSAYFVELDKPYQDHVMARQEYSV
ncbi:MAG: pyruvate formate-lyase [Clostridiales bacterium]|nr:pyruvate formate-lyase [Clostridiales bacterium]